MKPSEKCKKAGLRSLLQLSAISGESVQTLINWSKNKPTLFDTVLSGAVSKTNETAKFERTYCSSCGRSFGPGDHGFSHCEDHNN